MSLFRHRHKNIKMFLLTAPLLTVAAVASSFFTSCVMDDEYDMEQERMEKHLGPRHRDPLPGELVMQILKEDSIKASTKDQIKLSMSQIIQDYKGRFNQKRFNGYFLTDFNDDDIPELWVKVGSYRDNCKLELFYPMPDGTLKKSDIFAEPGQYFLGDGYMTQIVSAGPGLYNVNRISIHNGAMNVEKQREIDLYSDPQARIPRPAEPEIRDIPFTNQTPLINAFNHHSNESMASLK